MPYFLDFPYAIFLLFQVLCVVHVLKTGRDYKWIWLIMVLPGFGSAIYFWLEIRPQLGRGNLAGIEIPVFIKTRIKQAEKNLKLCESMNNRIELAELYAENDREAEALALIKDGINGPFKDSPHVLLTLAIIQFKNQEFAEALATLERIDGTGQNYRAKPRQLLRARILGALNRMAEAEAIYTVLSKTFDGEEANYWYAVHQYQLGKYDEAIALADRGIENYRESEALYRNHEYRWYKGYQSLRSLARKTKTTPPGR